MKLIDFMLRNTRKEGRRKGGGRAEGLGLKNFDCIWTGGGAAEGRSNTMFLQHARCCLSRFFDATLIGGRAAEGQQLFS